MKRKLEKKKIYVFLTITVASLLCGCGVRNLFQVNVETEQKEPVQLEESTDTEEKDLPEEETLDSAEDLSGEALGSTQDLTEGDLDNAQDQEKLYIGEYIDYDNGDPNLEIAKGEDGKYIVQIGIFRLCTLDDGVGKLTAEGMLFTATDPAGNPISGVITVEEELAKVTFTDSTWTYLENGTAYEYIKSSETPNIWGE